MFFKKSKNKGSNNHPLKDKLAMKLVSFIIKMQTGFANYMNNKTKHISISKMKMLLIVFCIAFSSYSAYLITGSILRKNKMVGAIKIDNMIVPKFLERSTNKSPAMENHISLHVYKKLLVFRKYMDSLQSSKSGKRIYDSILLGRPYLLDSLKLLEKLYQTNKK